MYCKSDSNKTKVIHPSKSVKLAQLVKRKEKNDRSYKVKKVKLVKNG